MHNTYKAGFDPISQIAPYELLEVANGLIKEGQVAEYWENVLVPSPPIGRVSFEVARQMATFAVPLVGLTYLYLTHGLMGALPNIPVAWFFGFLIDKHLTYAISSKRLREEGIDRGRYVAVNKLAEKMGMRPEEVTLAIIRKMDSDYQIVTRLIEEKAREAKRQRFARLNTASRHRRDEGTDENVFSNSNTIGGESGTRAFGDDDDSYDSWPSINPANGMPMIHGSNLDVSGNAYGTDWN